MNGHDHSQDQVTTLGRLMTLLGVEDDSWMFDFCCLVARSNSEQLGSLFLAYPVEATTVKMWQTAAPTSVAKWETIIAFLRTIQIPPGGAFTVKQDGTLMIEFPNPVVADTRDPQTPHLNLSPAVIRAMSDPGFRTIAEEVIARMATDVAAPPGTMLTCSSKGCDNPTGVDAPGDVISGSFGALGDEYSFYGRWCGWTCALAGLQGIAEEWMDRNAPPQ